MDYPLPNDFEATVQKIAASGAYPGLTTHLEKLAAPKIPKFDWLGAHTKEHSGAEKILQGVLVAALGSLMGAAGNLGLESYREGRVGNVDAFEAQNRELGQLQARAKFKNDTIEKLRPIHERIIKDLKKNDDIIKDADPKMVDSTFKTMTNFAPMLAADANAARSFIRTTIGTGADHPGFAVLQSISDAERSAQQAGGILGK